MRIASSSRGHARIHGRVMLHPPGRTTQPPRLLGHCHVQRWTDLQGTSRTICCSLTQLVGATEAFAAARAVDTFKASVISSDNSAVVISFVRPSSACAPGKAHFTVYTGIERELSGGTVHCRKVKATWTSCKYPCLARSGWIPSETSQWTTG